MEYIVEIRASSSLSNKSYQQICALIPSYLADLRAYTSRFVKGRELENIMWSYSNFTNNLLDALQEAVAESKSIEVDEEDSEPEDLIYAEAEVLAIKKLIASFIDNSYKDMDHYGKMFSVNQAGVSFQTSNPYQYTQNIQPTSNFLKSLAPVWGTP